MELGQIMSNVEQSPPAEAAVYSPELEGFSYPWPVLNFEFVGQGVPLHMAFMDVKPTTPNGRVVILLHGKNFCAGGDIHAFASRGKYMPDYIRVATAWLQNAVTGLMRLEAPVIASVQGFAAGGGGFGQVGGFVVADAAFAGGQGEQGFEDAFLVDA